MSGGVSRSTQTAELILTATNQTDRAFQQATSNMDKMGRAFERSAANQGVLFERAAGGVAGLERRLTAATAAMSFGEVLRTSVTEFAAIDRRMTRLGQNAEQSKAVIGNMKNELIKLALETGQSVESIFQGFETYVQQTGDYKQAAANIRTIAVANQALDADMKDTAQTARVLTDNLKFKPDDMMQAFEVFAQATRLGKFEAKDFAANMPVLAQAMNQAGMQGKQGLTEMAAVMELIARKSPDNERAVLAFRDLITKSFGTEVENHFKAAGSTLQGHLNNTLKNGGSVLSTIASQTKRTLEMIALAETGDKSKYMSFIGRLFPEEDSRRAATAIIEYFGEVPGLMKQISDGGGEVGKRFEQVKDDAASALERIGIKWFELKQQLGKSLIEVGVLDGMDKFSKDIDDAVKNVNALGQAIARIEAARNKNGVLSGLGQTFKEIGAGALGAVHAEYGRVTDYNIERAQKNAQKYRFKADQERAAGRPVTADRLIADAEAEEARLKRLRYQNRHGFDRERVFGNSDEQVQGSTGGAAADTMRMAPDADAQKRALDLLPKQRTQINTGPALPPAIDPNSAEGLKRQVEELRQDVEGVRNAHREIGEQRRRMAPEIGLMPAAPPAINQAPGHVPGGSGLIDPYAPPPGYHPTAYEGGDFASMIQKASLMREGGATTDTSGPTARGQQDQLRLTDETNAILRRLIGTANYGAAGSGLPGAGLGNAGLGGGGGGGGSANGGSGGGAGGGGYQMGGGGSGAGGVSGGTVPGSNARHPFGEGGGASGGGRRGGGNARHPFGDRPAEDGPTQDVPGAMNPRLAGSRKSLMDELDRDPALRRDVLKTASMENRGSAFKMQTVLESMVNRAKMNGYKSLRQAIHSGFYGPVNRGGLAGALSEKDRRDGDEALKRVASGSNVIDYRTDQGMLTDPGARRYMREADHSGHKVIGGENYFFMGQKGREWARRQQAEDARQGVPPTADQSATSRTPFQPGTAGASPPGQSASATGDRAATPLGEKGVWRRGYAAGKKNAFGGQGASLTDMLGPDKAPKKNAFGGATDLGGFSDEGERQAYGEFQGTKTTVPLPPRRPNINAPGPGTPMPPRRPDELRPKVAAVEPPGITRSVSGGNGKIYGALEKSPLPPRRPDIEAETEALKAHREEAEKPIKLRYHSDGLQPRNTAAESIAMRRGNDASMRHARQNSYSDTGVA